MKSNLPAILDPKSEASVHALQLRIYAAIVVGFLGLTLVWITAFAPLANIHNAAHDSRHSFATPCH